ncbi:hypothetical protein PFISCL1PPCAC_13721, partial [Pristionchus fissidentatus]
SVNCLVCAAPIKHCRLGVEACRACSVFYKRTLTLRKRLRCKGGSNDCITKDPKTSCRKCRFARFSNVLERAGAESSVIQPTQPVRLVKEKKPRTIRARSKPASFIDHERFYDVEPSGSHTPQLDTIIKAYSLYCLLRKTAEPTTTEHCRSECNEQIKDDLVFTPFSYSIRTPDFRIGRAALTEFAKFAFADFRALDEESKKFLVSSAARRMFHLEGTYRALHYFPNDDSVRLLTYTTYVSDATLESLLDEHPNQVNKSEALRVIRKNMTRSSSMVRRQFGRINPSEKEFVALLGLALWNQEVGSLNDAILGIVSRNRSAILKELHVCYAAEGRRDYAARLGDLLCLLENVESSVSLAGEDLEVYRLLNLFNHGRDPSER